MLALKKLTSALLPVFTLIMPTAVAQAQHLSVQEVPLTANHILYDSFNQKVYASIPSSAALHPNTIARIDAATHAVEAYLPVGSDPDVLALSSDGSFLYVGIDGTSSVARINLTTNTIAQQFSLGTASIPNYSYHAGNIVPLPGLPQSVAVTRDYFGLSPATDGVAVFDNGIQRPTILNRGISTYAVLARSNSPSRIYAYDNESTDFGFDQLNLDANGITDGQRSDSFGTGILEGNATIKFDPGNGLVYATNGTVVDPVALTDVGKYPEQAVDVVPSDSENRVYFLLTSAGPYYTETATLAVCNQTTFQQVSSFATSAAYLAVGDLYEISATTFVFRSGQGIEFAAPQTLSSLRVTSAAASVGAGKTDQFTATATYPDATTSDVTASATWTSDNTAVATISSAGLAYGAASGTAHISAALGGITSSPVTLTVTPVHSQILWNNTSGAASVWNYVADTGSYTHHDYGPYSGWTATAIADGGTDGQTRLLWNKTDGAASLWLLDSIAGTFSQFGYGPYTGWSASALSVAPDNINHFLWNNHDGRTSLWSQTADSFGSFMQFTFGPYSGWTANALADGSDGITRVLFTNADGRTSIETSVALSDPATSHLLGPYSGWSAVALSVNPNNITHVLWNNVSGRMALWNYTVATQTYTYHEYGPFSDWTAKAIADGSDGKTIVLWNKTDGTASLWSLDNITGAYTHHEFGPFSGWTAVSVAATP